MIPHLYSLILILAATEQPVLQFTLTEFMLMFLSGSIAFSIRFLSGKATNLNMIFLNISIIVAIIFIAMPIIKEYFNLSLAMNNFIVFILSVFNDKAMSILENKLVTKLNNIDL